MTHIVIIGAGLGGMAGAYELRDTLGKDVQITVVNERDTYQFVPSNPWIAVGWRKRPDISFPAAPYLAKKYIDFIAQRVDKIDPAANSVQLADGQSLTYDYLVIATGPKLSFAEVPGAGPHDGHTQSVCTLDHAEQSYADFQALLKNPGPVIVGAMPMASCFGPAYEYAFILETALRRAKMRDRVPMTYVSSEPYIVPRAVSVTRAA